MLVLNTSQPKRTYTNAKVISAEGQYDTIQNGSVNTMGQWFDKTNKYLYLVYARTDSPWLMIDRYTYDAEGVLGSKTPITLSGFGTFTSEPILITFQGGHSSNFYLACESNGGSGSFSTDQVYTVSISGTTATLGASLSVPSIASYDLNRVFAVGAVVYAFYRNTSTNVIDTGRKYSGSWSTLSSGALPSSVVASVQDSTSALGDVYGGSANKPKLNTLGAGSSHDKFFHLFENSTSVRICLKFDAATDTWSQAGYSYTQSIAELNGNIILHNNNNNKTYILDSSLTLDGTLCGLSFGGLSSARFNSPIIDLENGVWLFRYNTSNIATFGYFSGVAKRIGKISCPTIAGCGIIYRIDGGEWQNFIPTSTTDIFELDYYGETSLELFVTKTTGTLYVEVTD